MNQPVIKAFFDAPTFTWSYVASDPESGHAAIIDSVWNYAANSGRTSTASADEILAYVRQNELTVDWILETHIHADHLSAARYLQLALGGQTAISDAVGKVQKIFGPLFNAGMDFDTDGAQFDRLLKDGEILEFGSRTITVMHTPGHTPACMSFLIGDAVFVGDTLFMPDYGSARCDFPGGDAATLYRSIQKLFALPDDTRMLLCHDYLAPGRDQYACETTVGAQKKHNIHIHAGISEEDFVTMRTDRDKNLDAPKLLLPSVQVNMRAGDLPPAETNGTHYIKIPVDVI